MKAASLLLFCTLLCGCEAINDAFVRYNFKDSAFGRKVGEQLREGLERKLSAPPVKGPTQVAPAFWDQG
jgi:hypothetical protein